jgi:hypothetical protein
MDDNVDRVGEGVRSFRARPGIALRIAPVVPPVVADQRAVVVAPPPRPASCGEYRYWNGQYCADARYNRPYLGPKP